MTITVDRAVIAAAVTALAKMSNDQSVSQRDRELAFKHGCELNALLLGQSNV